MLAKLAAALLLSPFFPGMFLSIQYMQVDDAWLLRTVTPHKMWKAPMPKRISLQHILQVQVDVLMSTTAAAASISAHKKAPKEATKFYSRGLDYWWRRGGEAFLAGHFMTDTGAGFGHPSKIHFSCSKDNLNVANIQQLDAPLVGLPFKRYLESLHLSPLNSPKGTLCCYCLP